MDVITADDLRAYGCEVTRREKPNPWSSLDDTYGVKDTAGNWIGRVNETGVFEPNYSVLSGYKPRLRVRCK